MRAIQTTCAARHLALLTVLILMAGCGNRHILHQQEALSRDFTYVGFSRDTTPYVHHGKVGGEHSTFIKVLGFEGDCFSIKMQQEGDAGFAVFSEGGQVDSEGSSFKVTVNAPSDLFTIRISALSYGDYVLTITKERESIK